MSAERVDMLLRGGSVVDGTGQPRFQADVAIGGDRVIAVEPGLRSPARRTIDVGGLIVSPGFIDMHAHSDLAVLVDPPHEAKVRQGITLEVIGQDGLSYAPATEGVLEELRRKLRGWNGDPGEFAWSWATVGEYLARVDGNVAVNIAYLVPHGTVRMCVVGFDDRRPTRTELEEMKSLVARAMTEGAVGMSTGLTYSPAMYASDDELAELCKVVASFGGYYCPHHRNYGTHALESYASCVDVARRSGVALHLAHAVLPFAMNRGKAPTLLELLADARESGVDVSLDSYPYTQGATYLHALLPGWVQRGGHASTIERLGVPALQERIRVEIEERGSDGFHGVPVDWNTVIVSGVAQGGNFRWVGRRITEVAASLVLSPFDVFLKLILEEDLGVSCILDVGDEGNLQLIMTDPFHTVGSDGILEGTRPHPRGWGTFPRYLARYVRELGILTLEQTIRKMTSLPARRLGFPDRGTLQPGLAADVVCFDADAIRDNATFEEPRLYPDGVPFVIVNGQLVIDDGFRTEALPGRALRRISTRRDAA